MFDLFEVFFFLFEFGLESKNVSSVFFDRLLVGHYGLNGFGLAKSEKCLFKLNLA